MPFDSSANLALAYNGITKMTGYSKPATSSAITPSDTLNAAIGKLEAGLEAGRGWGYSQSAVVGILTFNWGSASGKTAPITFQIPYVSSSYTIIIDDNAGRETWTYISDKRHTVTYSASIISTLIGWQ